MIPILFDSKETAFTSNGLGGLSDAISCSVTEERNGEYELEMEYPISGIHYSDIKYNRFILAVPSDGADPEPFEIYKITRPISGKVSIYARHISYRLSYTVATPEKTIYKTAQEALNSLKNSSATECPFTFQTDVTTNSTFRHDTIGSIRSFLGGQSGSILDQFGGEYLWKKWNVSLLKARGQSTPIVLEYGKDITDLQQEENIASTYTAVIAVWSKKDSDTDVTDCIYSDAIKSSNADNFPYIRTFIYDCSSDFENAPSKADLNAKAQSYIKANDVGIPSISITVSFVALWQTEEYKNVASLQHINLCDRISVSFPALGIDHATAKVVKTDYDVLNDRYNSIELGNPKSTLAQTIVEGQKKVVQQTTTQIEQSERSTNTKINTVSNDLGGKISDNTKKIDSNSEKIVSTNSRLDKTDSSITAEVNARTSADREITGKLELKIDEGTVTSHLNAEADEIVIKAGKKFTVQSGNFSVDGSGNVTMKGNVTASTGKIGGFTLGNNCFYSGGKSSIGSGSSGVYIGTDGISVGQNTGPNTDGNGLYVSSGGSVNMRTTQIGSEWGYFGTNHASIIIHDTINMQGGNILNCGTISGYSLSDFDSRITALENASKSSS